ncbi:MAG: hypothetical protein ABEI75_02780 [Halobaculum sp.]
MLLIVAYTPDARTAVRNTARSHADSVVRRFGRAVLVRESEFGAFLACRLRAAYGTDVQVERTEPFNEYSDVPDGVREAARAYADRENRHTPYAKFAAGTDHPAPDAMRDTELDS